MRELFLNQKTHSFFPCISKQEPMPANSFLSRFPFGNVTYFRIVYWSGTTVSLDPNICLATLLVWYPCWSGTTICLARLLVRHPCWSGTTVGLAIWGCPHEIEVRPKLRVTVASAGCGFRGGEASRSPAVKPCSRGSQGGNGNPSHVLAPFSSIFSH